MMMFLDVLQIDFTLSDFIDIQHLKSRAWNILQFIIILILTVVIARVSKALLNKFINKSGELIKVETTQYNFFKHFLISCIYIVGFALAVYSIPSLRHLSLSIFAGAGILAAIIGFASQQAFSNIVSGIFIVIFRPFAVNDRVQIGPDLFGIVEDITLRHTVIRNFENRRIVIPNSIISSETVINSTMLDEKICKFIEIGISYDSDVDLAKKIIENEALNHPNCIDNRTEEQLDLGEPQVAVRVVGFGDSSVNLKAWVWAIDAPSAFKMGCDLFESIKKRFDKEGIEIPFPYRTIVFKKNMDGDPADKTLK